MAEFHELDQFLREKEQKEGYSGVVRLTRDGEEVFSGAYGYANIPWKIKNNLDLRFEIASMTKLFTAVSILQLVDNGLLSLDTSAISYLGIEDTPISDDVTVFHLLTHSSGIADDAEEEVGEDYADLWLERANYSITETADFLPQFIHKEPNFPPGEGCRYNNVGFILLGLMLEKATGMRYRDYVREHIFARAGMSHSDFLKMDNVYQNLAEAYIPVENEVGVVTSWQKPIYMRPPIGSPDGGAHTTVGDMDLFWDAARNGRLLSPELTKAFLTPQVHYVKREKFQYAYGFATYFAQNLAGDVLFYLGQGEDHGVSAKSVYFPKEKIQAVLLSNIGFITWPVVWKIYELLN